MHGFWYVWRNSFYSYFWLGCCKLRCMDSKFTVAPVSECICAFTHFSACACHELVLRTRKDEDEWMRRVGVWSHRSNVLIQCIDTIHPWSGEDLYFFLTSLKGGERRKRVVRGIDAWFRSLALLCGWEGLHWVFLNRVVWGNDDKEIMVLYKAKWTKYNISVHFRYFLFLTVGLRNVSRLWVSWNEKQQEPGVKRRN